MRRDISNDLARAEKLEINFEENSAVATYMNGDRVLFTDVEIYWPDLVREMYRKGNITRQKAIHILKRECGLTLKRMPHEPKLPREAEK